MSSRRRSITTERGFSLLEVIVACAIFVCLTAVIFALMRQNQRASQKVFGQTDASAEAMMVFEKVRNEMHHARVIGVDSKGRLEYWIAREVKGVPQVTSAGYSDWLPGAPADPIVARMYVFDGVLWRDFGPIHQPLAPVGPAGTVKFTWNPGLHNLELTGTVGRRDAYDSTRNNIHSFDFSMYLSNNE